MNLSEDTTPKPPKQLLGESDAFEAALPDFLHDFVWERERHKGSRFFQRLQLPPCWGPTPDLRYTSTLCLREFEGAPKLNSHTPTYLMLDRQQRLTSFAIKTYRKSNYNVKVIDIA